MRFKYWLLPIFIVIILAVMVGCNSKVVESEDEKDSGPSTSETETPDQDADEEESDEDEGDNSAIPDGSSVGDITNEVFGQQIRSLALRRLDEGQEYVLEWDRDSVEINGMSCSTTDGRNIDINLTGPESEFSFTFILNKDGSINADQSQILMNIDNEDYSSLSKDDMEFVYAEEGGTIVYGEAGLATHTDATALTGLVVFYINCGEID